MSASSCQYLTDGELAGDGGGESWAAGVASVFFSIVLTEVRDILGEMFNTRKWRDRAQAEAEGRRIEAEARRAAEKGVERLKKLWKERGQSS